LDTTTLRATAAVRPRAERISGCVVGVLSVGLALMAAICCSAAESQESMERDALSAFSAGLKLGPVFAQHTGTEERDSDYTVASDWRTGLSGGVFVYWPVTERFGLQQEVLFSQKGSRQEIGVEILELPTTLDVTYEMDYIEIPILMRFTWLDTRWADVYSLMGTALSLKINDRYVLEGVLDDGEQVVPISAEADMSEVDMFDYSFVYGLGCELEAWQRTLVFEYRFTTGWNQLMMPTYAYVPFGDEEILIENDPVPLKNQTHSLMFGICF